MTIPLERGDFFELKALILTAELAKQAAQAKLALLVVKQGGDPEAMYRLDEATCALVS